jgi:hypothetical protein
LRPSAQDGSPALLTEDIRTIGNDAVTFDKEEKLVKEKEAGLNAFHWSIICSIISF